MMSIVSSAGSLSIIASDPDASGAMLAAWRGRSVAQCYKKMENGIRSREVWDSRKLCCPER